MKANELMDMFFNQYFKQGDKSSAYQAKHKLIPTRLFKYQPIKESRIKTIKDGKIHLSTYSQLNDPFDCNGTYYDEDELISYLTEELPKGTNIAKVLQGFTEIQKTSLKVFSCANEEFNMPLWAHYGDNHRGMCVEYNFSQIPEGHELSSMIFPVAYEESRYNITGLIKMLFNSIKAEKYDARLNLLFFLSLIKHTSWSYEKEWRIVMPCEPGKDLAEPCPIKPTAIYLGMNCVEENVQMIKTELHDIPIFKLEAKNEKFFRQTVVRI